MKKKKKKLKNADLKPLKIADVCKKYQNFLIFGDF